MGHITQQLATICVDTHRESHSEAKLGKIGGLSGVDALLASQTCATAECLGAALVVTSFLLAAGMVAQECCGAVCCSSHPWADAVCWVHAHMQCWLRSPARLHALC